MRRVHRPSPSCQPSLHPASHTGEYTYRPPIGRPASFWKRAAGGDKLWHGMLGPGRVGPRWWRPPLVLTESCSMRTIEGVWSHTMHSSQWHAHEREAQGLKGYTRRGLELEQAHMHQGLEVSRYTRPGEDGSMPHRVAGHAAGGEGTKSREQAEGVALCPPFPRASRLLAWYEECMPLASCRERPGGGPCRRCADCVEKRIGLANLVIHLHIHVRTGKVEALDRDPNEQQTRGTSVPAALPWEPRPGPRLTSWFLHAARQLQELPFQAIQASAAQCRRCLDSCRASLALCSTCWAPSHGAASACFSAWTGSGTEGQGSSHCGAQMAGGFCVPVRGPLGSGASSCTGSPKPWQWGQLVHR